MACCTTEFAAIVAEALPRITLPAPNSLPFSLEELLHLREEPGALRVGVFVALALEFLQQFALSARQVFRRLDVHLNVHVALHLGAQHRHALALQAELLAALAAFRHFDTRDAALDGRRVDVAA